MLKAAGVDQFTVAQRLETLDPEQFANLTRIYQGHAIVVARHVEQLEFLQRHLRHQHWVADLEDRLVPELPWSGTTLNSYQTSPTIELIGDSPSDTIATIARIRASTPFETTRALSSVALLRLDDFSAHSEVREWFHNSSNPTFRDESALALTSWRVNFAVGFDSDNEIIDQLRASPFTVPAGVRLAALQRGTVALPPDASTSEDAETSLGAALITGDCDRLHAALLGDDLEQMAAATALIRLDFTDRIANVLRDGSDAVRARLIQELTMARKPFPGLENELVQIIETTTDESIRERAALVASSTITGDVALRIARAAHGEARIFQSLLQRSTFGPDDMARLIDFMIESGSFSGTQYGLSTVVENGRLGVSFVPTRFATAPEAIQAELLALAELQLARQPDDPTLRRFLVGVVAGPVSTDIRKGAAWVVRRCLTRNDPRAGLGLQLRPHDLAHYFGSFEAALPRLTMVIRDVEALEDSSFADVATDLFRSADDAFIAGVHSQHVEGHEMLDALIDAVATTTRTNVNESLIVLLSLLGTLPAWRIEALTALEGLDRRGNFHFDRALLRLQLAEFGIPTPDQWGSLPANFVQVRLNLTSSAGQMELLNVAEHQLIHADVSAPDAPLLEFLAGLAATSPSPEVKHRAKQIFEERRPHHWTPLNCDVT